MTTEQLKTRIYVYLGEEGTKALEAYGHQREREGRGAVLIAVVLVAVLAVALWPFVEAVLPW